MGIVFVHGLFPSIFDPPAGWTCPDLPGYGNNDAPASLPLAVESLRRLCVEPMHIVGHSIGGAIAVLLSASYPECVASVVNVEGNFTLKDAFWSTALARMSESEAYAEIARLRAAPEDWLAQSHVPVTADSLAIARRSLASLVRTIQSMARSVVDITSPPAYLGQVREILDCGVPFHLIAGEHSRAAWDVPGFVLAHASSFNVQPAAGHMLMWNDKRAFVDLAESAIG